MHVKVWVTKSQSLNDLVEISPFWNCLCACLFVSEEKRERAREWESAWECASVCQPTSPFISALKSAAPFMR